MKDFLFRKGMQSASGGRRLHFCHIPGVGSGVAPLSFSNLMQDSCGPIGAEPTLARPHAEAYVAAQIIQREGGIVLRSIFEHGACHQFAFADQFTLQPVFFDLDSSDINADGQRSLQENAEMMKQNPQWQVTIEGHCDERGTAEYNLALGERRAISARSYLVSLGIPAERVRVVSYGKEFPFEQGHDEAAWSKNRRAHFVITAK